MKIKRGGRPNSNKRTKKTQYGGAGAGARAGVGARVGVGARAGVGAIAGVQSYTQADVDSFCNIILHKLPPTSGYFMVSHDNSTDNEYLSSKFFEQTPNNRHAVRIKNEWVDMINNECNNRGQTPLYVALRFGAELQMIQMLLDVIKDVNRPNIDGDLSTPLIGLCFGKNGKDPINFMKICTIINIICQKGGDPNKTNYIKNSNGEYEANETMWNILQLKQAEKAILFVE